MSENKRPYKGVNHYDIISDYTVIDIETTGKYVGSCEIIEIAAVRVRNGQIVDTFESLVKPSSKLTSEITEITGITDKMLAGAPLCDEVIPEFCKFVGKDILVGHNIGAFDTCVLYDYYMDILKEPFDNDYVDTQYFAQKCSIEPENYKLTTIAKLFGIAYDAHRALNDCIANQKVYEMLKPLFDEQRVSKRVPTSISSRHYHTELSETTKALQELSALIDGIIEDNVLTDEEIFRLRDWTQKNMNLAGNYPFDSVFEKIEDVLEDGIITEDERSSLLELLTVHSDPVKSRSEESVEDLSGKRVCLTGEFQIGSRNSVTNALKARNVIVSTSVTSKTDYVIVGGEGSDAWSCGNYGTKVKKALELQAKGNPIKIIREDAMTSWMHQANPEYDILVSALRDIVSKMESDGNVPNGFLTFVSNSGGDISLWIVEPMSKLRSTIILNVDKKGKQGSKYISITAKMRIISNIAIPNTIEVVADANESSVGILSIYNVDEDVIRCLRDLIMLHVKQFVPHDKFGCCDLYKQCSDAKKCLHPDQLYAKACWYRKNLEDGKIFY